MQYAADITDDQRPESAPARLLESLRQLLRAPLPQSPRLLRAAVPVAGLEPLLWLAAQPETTQYFWSDRRGSLEMAGVGEADVLMPPDSGDITTAFATMQARLSADFPELRYYGGLRFQPRSEQASRWARFAGYRFVVPRFELLARVDAAGATSIEFACNLHWDDAQRPEELLASLEAALTEIRMEAAPAMSVELPPVRDRKDLPSRPDWDRLVDRALADFKDGGLDKIVLARETTFQADAPLDPVRLLWALRQKTIRSYEFCFHPVADRAFIGASPERLFKREGTRLISEAVAGTRPRGDSDAVDAAYRAELLASEKEQREHRFVVQSLCDHLDRFCESVAAVPEPGIMRLNRIQHLYTPLEGVLHADVDDVALLQTLHPTPAVGGAPREAALDWLRKHEPFDRGLYAAPVGWVAHNRAEFCVAIRSGLVEGSNLSVYSGAGIVPGSVAEDEWCEIENKVSNFLEALHHEPA